MDVFEKTEMEEQDEGQRLLSEGVTVVDFDMLCSTVAMQAQKGQWVKLNLNNDGGNEEYDYGGGVLRMWEGELFCDCLEDRRIAIQSVCCPWYRFGKNMKRAGFGSCFVQGDSSLDDCIFHLTCPCCTLSQEARTLEMNNVQDGIWHGRGDTICIGSYSELGKTPFELSPPAIVSTKS
ncbi:uncharacterized protein LOC132622391 isoform X2 [Lycium barbarum]|uniref:uncharacterized protein LOC132622391 isoform X2 n=1 Tax=Lycium barbarum TaxID=112863 RepID=UPI00293F41FE|nr:uncharacterized protein LOC132622391 isoform X2 [Lycium barbarum]